MKSSLWFFFQVYDIPPAQMYVGQHRNQGVYDVPPSQMDARAQGVYDVLPPSQGVRDEFSSTPMFRLNKMTRSAGTIKEALSLDRPSERTCQMRLRVKGAKQRRVSDVVASEPAEEEHTRLIQPSWVMSRIQQPLYALLTCGAAPLFCVSSTEVKYSICATLKVFHFLNL